MKKKIHLVVNLPMLVMLFLFLFLASCKKDKVAATAKVPPATMSDFTMTDSLEINPQYSPADIYTRYNGKIYTVSSTNKVQFDVQKTGSDIVFYFSDLSIDKLVPSFRMRIKNTDYGSLQSAYNLIDGSFIDMEDYQKFADGSSATGPATAVLKGNLKISYNADFKTISGEIVNYKMPLGYYVPEDIGTDLRSANDVYIRNGGSTRTVSLKFSYVKVK